MKETNKNAHGAVSRSKSNGKRMGSRSAFTLIELSLAMGILAVIMLVMMQFFSEAQQAWTSSYNRAEIFDNASIAMDLISRDLQCAYYKSQDSTHYTPFIISMSGTPRNVAFYSTTPYPPNDECTSPTCEVKYEWDSSDTKGWLKRYATGNMDDSGSSNSHWDIPPPLATSSPFNTADSAREVIPYVTDFEITGYDKNGTTMSSDNTPYIVKIVLSLMTKEAYDKWKESGSDDVRKRYERTFTKFVVIGDRGQE